MFPHSNVLVFVVVCVSLGTFSPISQREILSIQTKNYLKPENPARAYLTGNRWRKTMPAGILKNLKSRSLENGLNSVKKIMHVNVTLPSNIKPTKVGLNEVVNNWVVVPENDFFAYIVASKKGRKDNFIKLKRVKNTKNIYKPPLKLQSNKNNTKDVEAREKIFRDITGIDLSKINMTGLAEKFMNIDLVNIYSNKIKKKIKEKTNDHQNTKAKDITFEASNMSSVKQQHKEDISSVTDIEVKNVYKKHRTSNIEAAKKNITFSNVKSKRKGSNKIRSNRNNTSRTSKKSLNLLQNNIKVNKSENHKRIHNNSTSLGKNQNNIQSVKHSKGSKRNKFVNRKNLHIRNNKNSFKSNITSNTTEIFNQNEKIIRKTATTLNSEGLSKINSSVVSPLTHKTEAQFNIIANISKDIDSNDLDADDLNDIYDIAKIYITNDKMLRESLRNFTINKNEVESTHERPLTLISRRFKPDQFFFPGRILRDKGNYAQIIGKNNVAFNKAIRLRPRRHVVDRNTKITTKTLDSRVELTNSNDLVSKRTIQGVGVTTESVYSKVTGSLIHETGKDFKLFVIPLMKSAGKSLKNKKRKKIWSIKPKEKNSNGSGSSATLIKRMFFNNLPKGNIAGGVSLKVRLLNISGKSPRLVGIEINYASQIELPKYVEHTYTQDKCVHKNAQDSILKENIYNSNPYLTKEELEKLTTRKFNESRPSAKTNGTSSFTTKFQLEDVNFIRELDNLYPLTPHPQHQMINKRNKIIRPVALQMTYKTNVKNLNNILKENIKVFKKGQNYVYSKLKRICNKSRVKYMKREIKEGAKNYYDFMDRSGTPNQMELGFGNLGLKDEMLEQVLMRENGQFKKVPPKSIPVKVQNKQKQKQDPKKQKDHEQRSKNGTKPRYTYVRKHGKAGPKYHIKPKKVLWRNKVKNSGKNKTINSHARSKVAHLNKKTRNEKSTILDDITKDDEEFIISPKDKKETQKTFKIIRLKHLPLKEISRKMLLHDSDKTNQLSGEDDFMDDETTTEINMLFTNSEFDAVYNFRDKLYKLGVHENKKSNPGLFITGDFPKPMSVSVNAERKKLRKKDDLQQSEFLRNDFARIESPEFERNEYLTSGSKIRNYKQKSESQRVKLLKNGLQRSEYSGNELPRSKIVNYETLKSELPRHKIHRAQSFEKPNNEIPRKEWENTELQEYLFPKYRLNNNSIRKSSNVHENVLQSGVLHIPTDDRVGNFSHNIETINSINHGDFEDEEDISPDETPMNMLLSPFLKNPVRNTPIGHNLPILNYNIPKAGDTDIEDLVFGKLYKDIYNKKNNRKYSVSSFNGFEGRFGDKRRTSQLPVPNALFLKMATNKTNLPRSYVDVIPNLPYKIYGGQMTFRDNELLNNRHLISLWSTQRHKPREHEIVGGVGPMNIWRHHAIHYARPMPIQDYIEELDAPETDYDNEIRRRRKREAETKFRVLCILMQRTGEEEKIDFIRNTWGKRCDYFVVISSMIAEKQHPWEYTKSGLQFVHDLHHYDNVEWFLKADASTYIVMENLRRMVEEYDPSDSWFFGTSRKSYTTFVISRGALSKLVVQGQGNHACLAKKDNDISSCLNSLNIKSGVARDDMNRVLFYPIGPFHWDLATKSPDAEANSWSDYAVAFEDVPEKDLYTLEYFIYHVRPYAIPWSVIKKLDNQIVDPTTTEEPESTVKWVLKHANKTKKHIYVPTESIFETDTFYKEKRRQFQQGLFK